MVIQICLQFISIHQGMLILIIVKSFEDLCFLLGFNLNPLCLASDHPGKSGVDIGIIRKINQF